MVHAFRKFSATLSIGACFLFGVQVSHAESRFHLDARLDGKYYIGAPSVKIFEPRMHEAVDVSHEPSVVWEGDLDFTLRHPYGSLNAFAPIRGSGAAGPDMIGLRIELLVPPLVFFGWGDALKIGVYHNSDHNVRGHFLDHTIDVNALVLKARVYRTDTLEIWPEVYWYGLKRNGFANVVTRDANFPANARERFSHKQIALSTGVQVEWVRSFVVQTALRANASDSGYDAVIFKIQSLVPLSMLLPQNELTERFSIGGFAEYRRNITDTGVFGANEVIGGIQFVLALSDPHTIRFVGSDL